MNRRDFLKASLSAAALTGTAAGIGLRSSRALAAPGVAYGRTVINVMLGGGADLRYLFVPHPSAARDYASVFWEARQGLYRNGSANTARYPSYAAVWNDLYKPVNRTGVDFGIHKTASWLVQQFNAGNVAIVANVAGADNRNHDHAKLVADTGDPDTAHYVRDRDGWGGRLAHAIGDANTVAVTRTVSVLCQGLDSTNRNAKVVHAPDTRTFALASAGGKPRSARSIFARALKAYYAQKGKEIGGKPADWPYRKFFAHEQALRRFGDAVERRLAQVAPQQPRALRDLYTERSGNILADPDFGAQCASLYDSFLVADLFRLRVGSMGYEGWDTHSAQKDRFEANLADVFGAGKGLATLTGELANIGVADDIVYVFNSDFGRQLSANGSFGTDHGRGNCMIVVGESVRGGVYGELFPRSEIAGGPGNRRYDGPGADIEGLTSFERVLSAVCDWVHPGAGARVFPGARTSVLEPGVDLGSLMSA